MLLVCLVVNESYANGNAIPFPNVSGLEEEIGKMVFLRCSHYQSRYFFSGGSDKITYAVSGSHLGQEGIIGGDKRF
jgi:hypothetical protein